ncbi:MAG: hypothetical protein P4L87_01215 [Formivibrio sp.]|nr:hypothetical protein [Formivibrio sp.]
MVKLIIFWAVLVMSSPFIVMIGADQFQQSGWLAIGNYNFDVYDGLYRSLIFFLISLPVILAAYLGRPELESGNNLKINIGLKVGRREIVGMIIFCLLAFYFNLGITGVETKTGVFRLSGIALYVRSYLFLFFIAVYVFSSKKPSYFYVIIYSFVAGLTGGSRFAGVSPLVLLMMRNLIDNNWKLFNWRSFLVLSSLFFVFSAVTASRIILLDDNYSFSNMHDVFNSINYDDIEFMFQGFSQLFLRIGIGRDVILSHEVASSSVCTDLYGLFFISGSCPNPPLDFYGLSLDSDRFYLAPPMLSSLFVVSNNFFVQLCVSFVYSIVVFFMCYSTRLLKIIPSGSVFVQPAFFLVVVFVTIGPIYYAWILTVAIGLSWIVFYIIFKALISSG